MVQMVLCNATDCKWNKTAEVRFQIHWCFKDTIQLEYDEVEGLSRFVCVYYDSKP